MYEFCPQCGNPWSDIELEYQFCKDCAYQSPSDIDFMWDRIRKRINILNELNGRSEELEELIREKEHQILLLEFELRRVETEIKSRSQELDVEANSPKVEKDRFEEFLRSNLKKDVGSLFLAVGIIVKWGYLAFSFFMLAALTLGLFGIPFILIFELELAWWQSILVIIPFWLIGTGFLFYVRSHFEQNPSVRHKQRIKQNDTVLKKNPGKRVEGLEAKTLRLMWLKARVAELKKKQGENNNDLSSP